MVAIVPWSCELLRPRDATYFLRHQTRGPGRSLAGVEQVISNGASWWEITYDLTKEFDGPRLRSFETRVMQMQGRLNIGAICICDPYRYGNRRSPAQQPFADGTWFADGSGWVVGGTAPLLTTAAGAAGDTMLKVDLFGPIKPPLAEGDFFSVYGSLHRVTSALPNGTVNFMPALRRGVTVGAQLWTDPSTFYGRFASDDDGRRAREFLRWGTPTSITFVEAFERP